MEEDNYEREVYVMDGYACVCICTFGIQFRFLLLGRGREEGTGAGRSLAWCAQSTLA